MLVFIQSPGKLSVKQGDRVVRELNFRIPITVNTDENWMAISRQLVLSGKMVETEKYFHQTVRNLLDDENIIREGERVVNEKGTKLIRLSLPVSLKLKSAAFDWKWNATMIAKDNGGRFLASDSRKWMVNAIQNRIKNVMKKGQDEMNNPMLPGFDQ